MPPSKDTAQNHQDDPASNENPPPASSQLFAGIPLELRLHIYEAARNSGHSYQEVPAFSACKSSSMFSSTSKQTREECNRVLSTPFACAHQKYMIDVTGWTGDWDQNVERDKRALGSGSELDKQVAATGQEAGSCKDSTPDAKGDEGEKSENTLKTSDEAKTKEDKKKPAYILAHYNLGLATQLHFTTTSNYYTNGGPLTATVMSRSITDKDPALTVSTNFSLRQLNRIMWFLRAGWDIATKKHGDRKEAIIHFILCFGRALQETALM